MLLKVWQPEYKKVNGFYVLILCYGDETQKLANEHKGNLTLKKNFHTFKAILMIKLILKKYIPGHLLKYIPL